jgi:hypothetical protein
MDARISLELPRHPKTKKLIRRIGEGGAFRLVCLFLWVAGNRSSGDLEGLTDEDIELAVDWTGEPGAFVAALADVGFLDGAEGTRSVHDWAEHNPWAAGAEARSEKSRWAALCKQHGRKSAAKLMPDYAEKLLEASSTHAGSTETQCQDSASGTLNSASGTPPAVPDSASGMPLAGFGSAPSPLPSPSPSPLPFPKEEKAKDTRTEVRLPPDGGDDSPTPKKSKTVTAKQMAAEGVNDQHAADWLEIRNRKKAPLTLTAWEALKREAKAAGISSAEAVKVCAERGWQSFNASWNWRGDQTPPQASPPSQPPRAVRELSL